MRIASPLIGLPEISPPITRTSPLKATLALAPLADTSRDEADVSTVQRERPKRCT